MSTLGAAPLGSSSTASVRFLLQQVQAATEAGAYLCALMVALTLPDVCASLGDGKRKTSGSKYVRWLVDFAGYDEPSAQGLWGFRCSLLHEGSAHAHKSTRIAFIEPGDDRPQLHNLSTDVEGDIIRWYSVPLFIDEMITAVGDWLDAYGESNIVRRNLPYFVSRRAEGLPPHLDGFPVIA